jgi:hypothetical protein
MKQFLPTRRELSVSRHARFRCAFIAVSGLFPNVSTPRGALQLPTKLNSYLLCAAGLRQMSPLAAKPQAAITIENP